MGRISKACPLFPAENIQAALAFYKDQLAFHIVLDMDGYGIVERDGTEIHFWPCDDRNIAENTSAYFRTDDVDRLHADLTKTANEARMSEPEDRDWGMREFYVWDLNGNLLRFGQPLAGAGA